MKEDLNKYLKKILDYPSPSTNLSVDFEQSFWKPNRYSVELEDLSSYGRPKLSPLLRKLLYVKWYNSTISSYHVEGSTQDDTRIFKEGRHLKAEYVPFDNTYSGILSLGLNSTVIESRKKKITVGLKRRETILFSSYDSRIQVDLSSKDQVIEFKRLKPQKELFKEFCIQNSGCSLREVFPAIRVLSDESNLKSLSLEFISIKSSLFYGTQSVDCNSLGDSLLFFSMIFKDSCILTNCRKILEYIQSVLSENMISPNMVPSYLFLFDTLVFIIKLYDPNQASYSEIEYLPVNLNTINYNLLEMDSKMENELEHEKEHSLAFRKIFSIYKKILLYFNSNLHVFIKKEDLFRSINGILSRKKLYKHEILGILMHVTTIHNFFKETSTKSRPKEEDILSKIRVRSTLDDLKEQIDTFGVQEEINKNVLDYDFLGLVQDILKHLHEYLLKIKPNTPFDKLKGISGYILEIYYSLKYIDSKFITDIFCYGVLLRLNSFNISNIKRLRKYKDFKDEVVDRLKENRKIYHFQKELCDTMEVDLDPTYNIIEKKVLLNLSGIKNIKKIKYIPEVIDKGRSLEEDMFMRYKIYLYEYLKERNSIKDYEMYFR